MLTYEVERQELQMSITVFPPIKAQWAYMKKLAVLDIFLKTLFLIYTLMCLHSESKPTTFWQPALSL